MGGRPLEEQRDRADLPLDEGLMSTVDARHDGGRPQTPGPSSGATKAPKSSPKPATSAPSAARAAEGALSLIHI